MPCRKCTNYNRLGNFARDCRVGPRMVTPVNTRNPTIARGACFECSGTDHYKAACPRLNRAPRPGGNCQNQTIRRLRSWKQWQSSTWRSIHDGSRGSSPGPEHYDRNGLVVLTQGRNRLPRE
ncbi:hypothetical protein Tco_0789000, partial [Tanacetum coccineum]